MTDTNRYNKINRADFPTYAASALATHQAAYPSDTSAAHYNLHYYDKKDDYDKVYVRVLHSSLLQSPNYDLAGALADGMREHHHPDKAIKSIQQKEITIASGADSGTASLTSVDVDNCIMIIGSPTVFGQQRQTNTATDADDVSIDFNITSPTVVEASRNSSPSFAITCVVTIIELQEGMLDRIHRGTITIGSGDKTETDLIEQMDLTRSIVIPQGVITSNAVDINNEILSHVAFQDNKNVIATRHNSTGSVTVRYQAIQFSFDIVKSVQYFLIKNNDSNSTTATATPTAVEDMTKSIIFPAGGVQTSGVGLFDETAVHTQLTAANQITQTRNTGGNPDPTTTGWLVEFYEEYLKNVQRGTQEMSGVTSKNISINSVDTTKTSLTCLGATTPASGALDSEKQHFTLELYDDDTIKMKKSGTVRSVTAAYEVPEWT